MPAGSIVPMGREQGVLLSAGEKALITTVWYGPIISRKRDGVPPSLEGMFCFYLVLNQEGGLGCLHYGIIAFLDDTQYCPDCRQDVMGKELS